MLETLKAAIILRIRENLERIEHCFDVADQELIWKRANKSSNSIGHLLLHLNGNITQYIHSSLGGKSDHRARKTEFDTRLHLEKTILFKKHDEVVNEAIDVIQSLNKLQLEKMYKVQGFKMTGTDILVHVSEHYSYHTGQIAFWIKLNLDTDLKFYKDVNLDVQNE